jgi:hypothetical protein
MGSVPLPILHAYLQRVLGGYLTHHWFLAKPKTTLLDSGSHRRKFEPSNPPSVRDGKGKDTEGFLFCKGKCTIRQLADRPCQNSPSTFSNSSKRKQASNCFRQ